MDIHIFYEHVEREIYNVFLLKFELEKRGYEVTISRTLEPKLPFFNAPKLILVPWLFGNHNVDDLKMSYFRRFYKVLNLQYEQVMSQMWLDSGYHDPTGKAKCANQLCWGEKRKQMLVDYGFSEKNLVIIGDIRQDFTRPEFRNFFKSRKQLSEEFGIPEEHEWNLFISSFSYANPSDIYRTHNEKIIGKDNSDKWYLISKESQQKILEWIERFISENPNQEFIYRPHPTEIKSTDYSYLNELNEKYSNFHFIFKYSVQDWILSSDYINTWISTAIVECYSLNKVCNILRPIKVDEYFDIPFFINADQICNYELFKERNLSKENSKFPIDYEEIKVYYDTIGEDELFYKKICDYVEEMIADDSFKKDYYRHGPIIDNMGFILKKIFNNRIFAIFKDFINNNRDNELKNVVTFDQEKIAFLKKVVDENFDNEN